MHGETIKTLELLWDFAKFSANQKKHFIDTGAIKFYSAEYKIEGITVS